MNFLFYYFNSVIKDIDLTLLGNSSFNLVQSVFSDFNLK